MEQKSKKSTFWFGILLGTVIAGKCLLSMYKGVVRTTDIIILICCAVYISIMAYAIRSVQSKERNKF